MKIQNYALLLIYALIFTQLAAANDCKLSIEATDQMSFSQKSLTVSKKCAEIELTLKHVGSLAKQIMGHNWVLTTAANYNPVAMAGMSAGIDSNYVKADDNRVLASTKVIGGGESTTIIFSTTALEAGADYKFFCSFPGHFSIMQGKLMVSD